MKRLLGVGIIIFSSLVSLLAPPRLGSANLTSVKDTLSTSRLSINARVLASGTTVGTSKVQIYTVASNPSNTISTANLHAGDTLTIGASSAGYYTVIDIIDADEFTVSPVLESGDTDDGDLIYLVQKPTHTVTFNTASAVNNGFFQVLIPADATTPNDGAPDDQGFDFGGGSVTLTSPDIGNYDFVPAENAATASGGTFCTSPANYHCFEFHYNGTGGVGTAISLTVGSGANTPIAPATGTSHTQATADTYSFIVKNFANGANPETATPVDATTGKIALIEAVRVTATVEPTISFSIAGVGTGTSTCGATPDVSTATGTNAPLAVPFGSLANLNTFYDLSHNLEVSTNASGGYVVTTIEDDQLSIGGLGVTTIADTDCDSEDCTTTSDTEWVTSTDNGFGYSIDNIDAAIPAFEWDDTTPTTGFSARPFDTSTPRTIFSSTTVANAENVYVCYRLSVGATQAAGDYENQITYTATGTF